MKVKNIYDNSNDNNNDNNNDNDANKMLPLLIPFHHLLFLFSPRL